MDTKKFVTDFKEKGYVELRAFFSCEEIESLLGAMGEAKQCETGRGRLNDQGLIFNHNLYFHNPPIQKFVSQQRIIDILAPITGPNIWIRWDQLVTKQPGGVEFPWHQDNGYNGLKDEHIQFWIAMTQSTPENGGMWISPGSHRRGVLPHEWVGKHKVYQGEVKSEIPIVAGPGDVVVFSSMLLHRTKPNNSNIPRLAYVIEYMATKFYDPHLKPPFFMVSKNGISSPAFTDSYAGRKNPFNRLKYSRLLAK